MASNEELLWYVECSANNIATINTTHNAIIGGDDGIASDTLYNASLVLFTEAGGSAGALLATCTANAIVEGKLHLGSQEYL